VCNNPGAHLQRSKTVSRQEIRVEPQIASAVVTCAVPGLGAFYSLILRSGNPGCALFEAHAWARLLVFKETFVQTVFAVVNCAVVGLSVFYSLVLTCSLILLQL